LNRHPGGSYYGLARSSGWPGQERIKMHPGECCLEAIIGKNPYEQIGASEREKSPEFPKGFFHAGPFSRTEFLFPGLG
jgi:hypothetical protein